MKLKALIIPAVIMILVTVLLIFMTVLIRNAGLDGSASIPWYAQGYPFEYSGLDWKKEELTRAEAALFISTAMDIKVSGNPVIKDIPEDHWAREAVAKCITHGLMYSPVGYYRPDEKITRSETAELVRLAAGHEPFSKGEGIVTRGEFISAIEQIEEFKKVELSFPAEDISWAYTDTERVLFPQIIDEESWLFLPSAANPKAFNLTIDDSLTGASLTYSGDLGSSNESSVDVTSIASRGDNGEYKITVSFTDCGSTYKNEYKIIFSSNISALFVQSDDTNDGGRLFVEKTKGNTAECTVTMLSSNGETYCTNGKANIKSRGNSTFIYHTKKSYQIKLDKKSDLLGNGQKQKTWILLAQQADATIMRDKLCKDLAADIGIEGNPDCSWVDLYYDGEYRGLYQISEKIRIGENSLEITDLEELYSEINPDYNSEHKLVKTVNKYGYKIQYAEGVKDPEDLTTGFLIEENYQSGSENCWFRTKMRVAFNVKSPENVSKKGMRYISELFQSLENAAYSSRGIDSRTRKSYTDLIDEESFARMYLLYLFSDNWDAYCQSTYYYLKDGIFFAGPMWDSDQSFGIAWDHEREPDEELRSDHIIAGLIKIKSFQETVQKIYREEFRDIALKYADKVVKEYYVTLRDSEQMNHIIWPNYFLITDLSQTYPDGTDYASIAKKLSDWMVRRIEYMDGKFLK